MMREAQGPTANLQMVVVVMIDAILRCRACTGETQDLEGILHRKHASTRAAAFDRN